MNTHTHLSSDQLTRNRLDGHSSPARRGDTLQYAAKVAQAIAAASSTQQSTSADDAHERHFEFRLDVLNYALPLANVLAIELPPATTRLPFVPAWHTGIADLRGDIISVIDLRILLGMDTVARTPSTRIIVARALEEETAVGLVVDAASKISRLDSSRFALPTGALTAEENKGELRFVRGISDSIVVLDAGELFRALTLGGTESVAAR